MKVCVTREEAVVGEWSVPDLEAALAAHDAAAPIRIDVFVGEKLLTIFRGDPDGLSVDLRYEGHRLNARIAIVNVAELMASPDIEAWLRTMDAHDEGWNIEEDRDFRHAREVLG
jgi:hypothetical protein